MLISTTAFGQFLGGDGDGYSVSTFFTAINIQEFYCSGGDADGYQMSSSGIIIQNEQDFYCGGGNEDGFSMVLLNTPISVQEFYCSGGDGDAYIMQSSGIITPNDASIYCSGGNEDGYNIATVIGTLNTQNFYCNGSYGDGYNTGGHSSLINEQNFYCSGGDGDGFSIDGFTGYSYGIPLFCNGGDDDGYNYAKYDGSVFGTNMFCLGGNGDGYGQDIIVTALVGVGMWTGLTNTDWNTSSNWLYATIPNFFTNVTIPATCPNYPELTLSLGINYPNAAILCHRLEINQGASMSTTNVLYVQGEMLVHGSYISTRNGSNTQRIYNGGLLTITSTGSVKLGNQSSGFGITDLVIYNGGTLSLEGGILEVDDHVQVRSGGGLNMTGGELFVHKYGNGSYFSSFYPANFYVESGAQGSISGGTLKICGKESEDDYHAFTILEPTFDFTGTSVVQFQHGVSTTHYDASIYAVDGVTFQNLVIDKPGNTVFVESNLDIENDLNIETGSTLEIETGNQITVGP